MTKAEGHYTEQFKAAFKRMFDTKAEALEKNLAGKKADQGKRGELTSGKHLDGVVEALGDILYAEFGDSIEITATKCNLPGFYRPIKNWDMLIKYQGDLLAAIELKSIFSSYGNNANNRTEEALGTAVDFKDMLADIIREEPKKGAATLKLPNFGALQRPFTGFIFVLPEDEETTALMDYSKRNNDLFTVDEVFHSISYKQRFELACKRMKDTEKYSAAAVIGILDTEGNCDTQFVNYFIIDLVAHVKSMLEKYQTTSD